MKDLNFLKKNIIAHRGIHTKYPENSIKAFKEALKYNYIIEFDVHLLKDNTIVVFHDDNLRRMTGKNKKLNNCTYDDIKNIKLLNTNNYIPKLEDALKLIDGKVPIIVETKYDTKPGLLEHELVKRLDNYKGEFCVKSFSPLSIRWFKKNRPNYIRGLLISTRNKTFLEKIIHTRLINLLTRPDFISCNYRLCNNKNILRHKKQRPVIAWTIKNDKNFAKYKDKFDNLIVDTLINDEEKNTNKK